MAAMEIIAIPLMFLLLLCLVPGFILANSALLTAQKKLPAQSWLISAVLIELLINSGGPLLFKSHGGKIYGWSLLFYTFYCYFFSAIVLGPSMYFVYRYTKNNWFRIIASSIFLSAGLFPVTWFTLTKYIAAAFGVKLGT
ncbi:MAG TPA: hypothetical protein VNV14_05740 [Opitutaceae bacterium]|jgi:hypothetical protein|nr:hypothetical protein [Opitutaceae bacterium]